MTDITLVVTTHSRPDWLKVSLTSILASARTVRQTTRVLVMDDASSTLDARRIARRLRVEYRRLPHNVGYAAARVAALEDVDSPFLAFIDDDDALLPNWHRLHLDKIAEGHDVVSASYWETYAGLKRKEAVILEPATLEGLLAGHVPVNDGSLIRTSVLEGIPWRPERDKVMMMSMWLALAANGRSFATITEPCWLHRLHGSNMSASLDEQDAAFRREAIAEWA